MSKELDLTRASKYIALLLRHKPEDGDLTLDSHGWCDSKALVKAVARKNNGFTFEDLEKIVATDEKTRYSFNENKTKIRANQGHSINVDVELKKDTPPDVLYHGTASKSLNLIFKDGLKPMSRLYVHLSKNIETATKVGTRHGTPIILSVDTKQMALDGYEFFISENGVWLTKEVPAKYLTITQ
jgi:putative RNA 2'-phosphotransferase